MLSSSSIEFESFFDEVHMMQHHYYCNGLFFFVVGVLWHTCCFEFFCFLLLLSLLCGWCSLFLLMKLGDLLLVISIYCCLLAHVNG